MRSSYLGLAVARPDYFTRNEEEASKHADAPAVAPQSNLSAKVLAKSDDSDQ